MSCSPWREPQRTLTETIAAQEGDSIPDCAGVVVAERRWLHKAFDHGGASLRQTGARLAISGEPCLNPKKKKSPKYETLQNLYTVVIAR